jgi:hypothetical protein
VILIFSSVKVKIDKFEFINKEVTDMKIVISLAFLNKINLFKITLNKSRLNKIEHNRNVRKIVKRIQERLIKDYKYMHNFERKSIKEILEIFKYFNISNVEIDAKIGTEDSIFTSFVVTAISIIITFFIARKVVNTRYKILPVYINENYLNLSIKCIISIKLVHIISIIKELERKDRDKKNGRAINRRTYANSNG